MKIVFCGVGLAGYLPTKTDLGSIVLSECFPKKTAVLHTRHREAANVAQSIREQLEGLKKISECPWLSHGPMLKDWLPYEINRLPELVDTVIIVSHVPETLQGCLEVRQHRQEYSLLTLPRATTLSAGQPFLRPA